MHAMLTRLLGASAPNTEAGTKYGAAAAAAAVLLRKFRREMLFGSIAGELAMVVSYSQNGYLTAWVWFLFQQTHRSEMLQIGHALS
jgi:hypothetical protein